MTRRQRLILMTLGASAVVLVLAGIIAREIHLQHEADAPVVSTVYVPSQFKALRKSPGHVAHAEAGVACHQCHTMVGDQVHVPRLEVCVGCHEGIATELHEARRAADPDTPGCLSCHAFGTDVIEPARACLRCHGELGRGEDAPRTRAPQIGAHQNAPCETCHKQHEAAVPMPGGCPGCHKEVVSGHGAGGGAVADQCLQCHHIHERAAEAAGRCAACHAEQEPKIQSSKALVEGHDLCTTCHVDHAFTRETVKPCASCHDAVKLDPAHPGKPHRECIGCHAPHDVKQATPKCLSCHKDAARHDHPAPEARCASCHVVHGHEPPKPCQGCHADVIGAGPPHAEGLVCTSCHKAHDFLLDGGGADRCAGCHELQRGQTRPNKGHRACLDCHQQAAHHPEAEPVPCIKCHLEQSRTAMSGHLECDRCHFSHSGALKPDTACQGCHRDQARTTHGREAPCTDCHRAHGPKGPKSPPPCASCHKPASLPGLHAVAEHQACVDCHRAHEKAPDASRLGCVRCHKAQAGHEPRARVCNGCHVFK